MVSTCRKNIPSRIKNQKDFTNCEIKSPNNVLEVNTKLTNSQAPSTLFQTPHSDLRPTRWYKPARLPCTATNRN